MQREQVAAAAFQSSSYDARNEMRNGFTNRSKKSNVHTAFVVIRSSSAAEKHMQARMASIVPRQGEGHEVGEALQVDCISVRQVACAMEAQVPQLAQLREGSKRFCRQHLTVLQVQGRDIGESGHDCEQLDGIPSIVALNVPHAILHRSAPCLAHLRHMLLSYPAKPWE